MRASRDNDPVQRFVSITRFWSLKGIAWRGEYECHEVEPVGKSHSVGRTVVVGNITYYNM